MCRALPLGPNGSPFRISTTPPEEVPINFIFPSVISSGSWLLDLGVLEVLELLDVPDWLQLAVVDISPPSRTIPKKTADWRFIAFVLSQFSEGNFW